ncbi:MAG: acyl-CoA dehydrogenase [Mariprofundaceae bacterium]
MLLWILSLIATAVTLAYQRLSIWVWSITFLLLLLVISVFATIGSVGIVLIWLLYTVIFIPILVPSLRTLLVSRHIFAWFRNMMPPISQTERAALEAGDTWWDAELFSGKPNWSVLSSLPPPQVHDEEQAFLDGPVSELCAMLDDWKISDEFHDLPDEAWSFLKQHGFFGMVIPKSYGGLGFSAQAHSQVVVKISSRSLSAAVTAMVPNSLGPGQLLLNYGTEEQKNHYLPRLACGDDIPCFALTSPEAGSDAASMVDHGVVCTGQFEGEQVLGILLNWRKRYITLAPVASLLGLAFKLYDPDHLIGEERDIGITLALIPTDTHGISIGDRHRPMHQVFQNGPVVGENVFIPLEWIIGGEAYAGKGWGMLMECLAEGRSISLPALSSGASKLSARAAGAYARIRKQFNVPIGRFEGVEEALARIGGHTYAIDAMRTMTANVIDQGLKPSVISAMVKYHATERMRTVVNDSMDLFGGSAICQGPHNLMGRMYDGIPISITVEGANILTRSLIIFGQGVIRCHPYLLKEMEAVGSESPHALQQFDQALFAHIGFAISNKARAMLLAITCGKLSMPPVRGACRSYAQQVERLSAALAFVSDLTLAVLGGSLKRRESLSARLGDLLSQLYIVTASIRHYQDQGEKHEDLPLLQWSCEHALYQAEHQLSQFLHNFPVRWLAWFIRLAIFPFGKACQPPHDALNHQVASLLMASSDSRDRLTHGIYLSEDEEDPIGRFECALLKVEAAADAESKISQAIHDGKLRKSNGDEHYTAGHQASIIDDDELHLLQEASRAVAIAIAVDIATA